MNDKFDTGGIAEYLGLSRHYVTDVLVKQEGFPKPIINRGPRLRRWLAADIVTWAAGDSQSLEAISSEEAR